jgi:hypothetical protein
MQHSQRAQMHHPLRPLVLALALCGSATAWAEQSPYHIGVSQGFTHYSNVFQSTNDAQSDTVSSTGILGGINLELGRQRLYASGSAQTNRYQNFDQLNNVSYGLTTGLDWQTIERLSGSLRYATNQSLVNYADVQFPVGTKDVQKTQSATAAVRYGITPRLGIDASATRRAVDYSAAEDRRGFTQNSASLGVRWGGTGLLTFGAALRLTKSDFPSALIVAPVPAIPETPTTPAVPAVPAEYGPDKADRKDLDLTGSWSPSGLSTLTGRVSLTRETHTQPAIPELSGLTGSIAWDYRPTGKLALNVSLTRDTGTETTFALPSDFIPLRANNDRINTVAALEATYEVTAKIKANASLRHTDGSVVNSLGASRGASTNVVAIGANYAITRSVDLSCNLSHESRSRAYNASTIGCSGRFTLR